MIKTNKEETKRAEATRAETKRAETKRAEAKREEESSERIGDLLQEQIQKLKEKLRRLKRECIEKQASIQSEDSKVLWAKKKELQGKLFEWICTLWRIAPELVSGEDQSFARLWGWSEKSRWERQRLEERGEGNFILNEESENSLYERALEYRKALVRSLQRASREIFQDRAPYRVVAAGRGFGKSYLGAVELIYSAIESPSETFWFLAPTYKQGKEIAWELFLRLVPGWLAKKNERDLELRFFNQAKIAIKGTDHPDSLRGSTVSAVVLDEYGDIKENLWSEVIQAACAKSQNLFPWTLFLGTPKGRGGFYELFLMAEKDPRFHSFHKTSEQGSVLTEDRIQIAKEVLDKRVFAQEYLAEFLDLTGAVYHAFDPQKNILEDPGDTQLEKLVDLALDSVKEEKQSTGDGGCTLEGLKAKFLQCIQREGVVVGMDFNVNPMSAVLGVWTGESLYLLDEIVLENSHTEAMAEEIRMRLGEKVRIRVYPDPSGRARKTSAGLGVTDISILESAPFSFEVESEQRSPWVRDRINAVNAFLCSASNHRRLFLHPRCQQTIRSLEHLRFLAKSREPDKQSGYDHLTDAVGYLVCGLSKESFRRSFIALRDY